MIGKTLGHYEILAKIGAGGMGEVYRAHDTKLDRDVALKVLPEAVAADSERRARFEREAKAIARVQHPNIVTIHSVEEEDGTLFLTMELVEGSTLSEELSSTPVAVDRVFELAVPLVEALSAAHAVGITHRDLKPANVMVDTAGRVKVLDFGLAKLMEPDVELDDATIQMDDITDSGRILGTVSYMSPEQAEGKSVDARSDVFSLGVLLYEMASGRKPFDGETRISTLSAILKDQPANVVEVNQRLPRHLGRIIHRCLAKEPERRYQSALDLRNDLESLREELGSGEQPTATVHAKPKIPRAALVLPLLAIGLFLAWMLARPDAPQSPPAQTEVSLDFNAVAVLYFENLSDPEDSNRLGRIAASLLTPALSTSSDLTMISEQRLFDILRKLKHESAAIDRTVASQVAREAGAGRVVLGQVSMLGERLSLTSQVVDMQSGAILSSHRAEGEGQESLFQLVNEIAGLIITDLEGTTANTDAPNVTSLTTGSLDAYREYRVGLQHMRKHQFDLAFAAFDRAIELDPDFAMAHFYRSRPWWPFPAEEEAASLRRARHFADRAIPSESILIESVALWNLDRDHHAALALLRANEAEHPADHRIPYLIGRILMYEESEQTGFVEAIEAFHRAMARNPDDTFILNALGYAYQGVERYDDAIATLRRYVSLEPENPNARDSLGEILLSAGRLEEARESFEAALRLEPMFFSRLSLAYVDAMLGDFAGAIESVSQMTNHPNDNITSNYISSTAGALIGLFCSMTGQEARGQLALDEAYDRAVLTSDNSFVVFLCFVRKALSPERYRDETCQEVASPDEGGRIQVAIAEAVGRAAHGEKEAFEAAVAKLLEAPIVQRRDDWRGTIEDMANRQRIVFMVEDGDLSGAIDLQREIRPMREYGWQASDLTQTIMINTPLEQDAVARGLIEQNRLEEAIQEYRYLLHPDREAYVYRLVPPIYHYRLGMLLERTGETQSAIRHYQEFVYAWAEADEDRSELRDAQSRLARLTN